MAMSYARAIAARPPARATQERTLLNIDEYITFFYTMRTSWGRFTSSIAKRSPGRRKR
jgi:hypothetical protein